MQIKYYILLGLVAVVLVGCIAIWKRVKKGVVSRTRRAKVSQMCSRIPSTETICVLILADRPAAAATTLDSVYNQSTCPYRIFVALLEVVGRDSAGRGRVMTEFLSLNPENARFKEQIRSRHVSPTDYSGSMWGSALMHDNCYRNEKYRCTIEQGVVMLTDWDANATKELSRCPTASAILTTIPGPSPHPTFAASLPVPETSLGFPHVVSRTFKKPFLRPCKGLFFSRSFSFCLASVLAAVHWDPAIYDIDGLDLLMSARMWTHGIHFYHPSMGLAVLQDSNPPRSPPNSHQENDTVSRAEFMLHLRPKSSMHPHVMENIHRMGLGFDRSLSQYEKFCGVRFADRLVTGRAQMGLTPTPSEQEIMTKYGTHQAYRAARSAFSGK